MRYVRAALPWALAATLAAAFMFALARHVLPVPSRADAAVAYALPDTPDAQEHAASEGAPAVPLRTEHPPHAAMPDTLEDAAAPPSAASASRDEPEAETAWRRVASLRARLRALEGDGGATGQTAAAALRIVEVPQILEEAGISDEPFASRLAAYRDAVSDGGHAEALSASLFTAEDRERLRLLDALGAL